MDGLRDKMKYLRNAKPRGIKREAADEYKVTEHESEGSGPPNKKQYKGKYPSAESMIITSMEATGEDKNSHDRHVKLMQLEERKVSPDLNILADLMKRTFSIRRTEIIDEPQPVHQLLKAYPSLRRSNQVIQLSYICLVIL